MVKVGSMRLELPARADLEIYEPARATPMARLEWLEPRPTPHAAMDLLS